MAAYNPPVLDVDPIEIAISQLFNQMVLCVNQRREAVLTEYRDLRNEIASRPQTRAKEEEELIRTKTETERNLQMNKFHEFKQQMLAGIEQKLAEVRKPQPDTRVVFRIQSAPLEQLIAELGEVLEEEVTIIPNYLKPSPPKPSPIKMDTLKSPDFETASKFSDDMEECPHCKELFQVIWLPGHTEICLQELELCTRDPSPPPKLIPTVPSILGNRGDTCQVPPHKAEVEITGVDMVTLKSSDFETASKFSDDMEKCPYCKELFQVIWLPGHTEICDQIPWIPPTPPKLIPTVPAAFGNGGIKCDVCFDVVVPSEMKTHMEECLKNQIGELNDLNTKNYNRCLSCLRDFPPCEFNSHIRDCDDMLLGDIDRFKTFSPNLSEIDWASAALTREQRDAMDYVVKKAKTLSDQADSSLFQRIGKLGFNKDDLDKTLEWIKMDSPIIIHVFLDKLLPILINETHYKNQFETGTSHGSRDLKARKTWENNIFNNIYDKAEGRDRVKYGVLNIVGDIRGVKNCKQYGDSFFILRKVRLRTSFASADSSLASVKIASCEHYKHVLNEYMDNELTAVIQVATKKKPFANSDVINNYKEVQIHGPIVLGEHIECVFYHERHRNDKPLLEMLDNFRIKNNCNVVPMKMP